MSWFFLKKAKRALSPKQQAALKLFQLMKEKGNATTAVQIVERYGLPMTANDYGNLWNAVARAKPSDRGKHWLAIVPGYAAVTGEPVDDMLKLGETILAADPECEIEVACTSGFSDKFRMTLLEQLLAEGKISVGDLLLSFQCLSRPYQVTIGMRSILYALERDGLFSAHQMALLIGTGNISGSVRKRLVTKLLGYNGPDDKERVKFLDAAVVWA